MYKLIILDNNQNLNYLKDINNKSKIIVIGGGFAGLQFIQNIKKDALGIEIQYHIVGFGDPSDIEKIKQYKVIFYQQNFLCSK